MRRLFFVPFASGAGAKLATRRSISAASFPPSLPEEPALAILVPGGRLRDRHSAMREGRARLVHSARSITTNERLRNVPFFPPTWTQWPRSVCLRAGWRFQVHMWLCGFAVDQHRPQMYSSARVLEYY